MDTQPSTLLEAPGTGSTAAGAVDARTAPLEALAAETQPGRMQPLTATDLQDHLLVATNDLDRLQRLLADASEALVVHFHGAAAQMKHLLRQAAAHPELDSTALNLSMDHLARAITSLQFQDMASQLLTHTGRRLRSCADRLAAEAMEMDDTEEAYVDTVPLTLNPVTQDEMDAGSVELF